MPWLKSSVSGLFFSDFNSQCERNNSYTVIYSHNKYSLYTHIHVHAASQRHNNKDRRTQKHAGRLLYKIFYLTSLFVSFERVVPSLRVRESWRPNITEIFWPQCYSRQRCVFLVLHGCSTGPWSKLFCVLAFPTTSRLPPSSTVLLALLLAYL